MTSAKRHAQIVRVRFEEGKTGLFYATSPDLRGLLVAESTLDAVVRAIPKAIMGLYAAVGESVVVTSVDRDEREDDGTSWVAFPAEVAKRALAEMHSA